MQVKISLWNTIVIVITAIVQKNQISIFECLYSRKYHVEYESTIHFPEKLIHKKTVLKKWVIHIFYLLSIMVVINVSH